MKEKANQPLPGKKISIKPICRSLLSYVFRDLEDKAKGQFNSKIFHEKYPALKACHGKYFTINFYVVKV